MLCAYELQKDACQGDFGRPLAVDSKLVGIVSQGNGCAKENYSGVYSDVAEFRSWILEIAGSSQFCTCSYEFKFLSTWSIQYSGNFPSDVFKNLDSCPIV